ncbi:MAG: DNA mismatch repair protein MutL [Puniceicoccaceae bacterium]|nr:DNA mismatch repair protein MutL [Puniceicoccaceae bacterium]
MSKIKILSDRVANQIAAGEVIERPVAVIKELVENSIDAGATKIAIEIKNGGKSTMQISDNGMGMAEDEALLALERHATSKLTEAADLNSITSFGFRGEALPSIASVSKFTLKTRTKDRVEGTEILIHAGKLIHKKACGMPQGTSIRVDNLFMGVPARRKFLKTEATESAHIHYMTRLFALAHPSIAFELIDSGKVILKSPPCRSLEDRITELWNQNIAKDLIPISAEDSSMNVKLTGCISKIGIDRSSRRELFFFVNRRPVDSRTLSYAVLDAYKGRIPKGRFPIVFLFLEIFPAEIDVNIHPTKKEIRFRQESQVRQFVLEAIFKELEVSKAEWIANDPVNLSQFPHAKSLPIIPTSDLKEKEPIKTESPLEKSRSTDPNHTSTPSTTYEPTEVKEAAQAYSSESKDTPVKLEWRFLHRRKDNYALYETAQGIVFLNILRARQRIRYESILEAFKRQETSTQTLMIPLHIEVEPLASSALEYHLKAFAQCGFTIEPFAKHCYRVFSIPNWLNIDRAESYLRDLIDEIRTRGSFSKNARQDLFCEQIAQAAIQSHFFDTAREHPSTLEKLPSLLFQCKEPLANPVGKRIFFELDWSEIEKKIN